MYNSKAGIASPDKEEQLIIALEPEAGAIFCKERKVQDFLGQTGSAKVSDALVSPGKSYVMMDIGGTKNKLIACCFLSLQWQHKGKFRRVEKAVKTLVARVPSGHNAYNFSQVFTSVLIT